MEITLLSIGCLTFLVSVIMAFRSGQKSGPANSFLVLFVLVLFAGFVLKFSNKTGLDETFPHLLKLNYPLGLLRPTFFFLSVFYFTNPGRKFEGKMLIHFIPFLIVTTYFLPYYMLPANGKIQLLSDSEAAIRWTVPSWYAVFGILYGTFYCMLSLRQFIFFREFRKKIDLPLYRRIRSWLLILLAGHLTFIFFVFLAWIFRSEPLLQYYPFLILSLLLMVAAARMFTFPDLQIEEKKKEKYSLQEVPLDARTAYLKKIKNVLESEKLYKVGDLKLSTVSEKTGIAESVVSALVSEMEGIPFSALVDKYRIDSAKKMLKDPHFAHFTIEGIGYEVGFHSRASFFHAFKRETNQSPAEFKRSI